MLGTILCGALFAGLGILMFLRPEWVWELTEKWKSYAADEPSDLYKLNTKIGGVAFALVGLAAMALPFILK